MSDTIHAADRTAERIHLIIDHYKAHFSAVDQDERYKWVAIGWYKQHWNIEAEDFPAMLAEAFSKADNLLASGMYYPYKMIVEYAKADPEAVRSIFRTLHDESLPLAHRYDAFRFSCQQYIDGLLAQEPGRTKHLNHYQDLRAVMVYLTFQYPEKYFLFKSNMYTAFRDRVFYAEEKPKNKTSVSKVENYFRLCGKVLAIVQQDAELIAMHKARLTANCYADEALHLLTMDIVFYGSVYMKKEDFEKKVDITPAYWPALEEYDPKLTKEDWVRFLLEVEKPHHPTPMKMLKAMLELGGETSCRKLASVYGGEPSSYVGSAVNLGRRAKKFFDLPAFELGDHEVFYIIPFRGRYVVEDGVKSYSYLIRPELHAALKEIDLSDISPYYHEEDTMQEPTHTDVPLNTILYGPPGTGKTYHTAIYAVAIIENKALAAVEAEDYAEVYRRYNEYKKEGLIEFTTFHQSYGYEEFIEGIRPAIRSDDAEEAGSVTYSIQPGVFKRFCEHAERSAQIAAVNDDVNESPTIWKVSLDGTGDNPTRTECLKNGHIRIGWDQYGKDVTDGTDFSTDGGRVVLNAFINRMQIGDIVLSCYSASTIDAIGVVTGDYEWHDEYPHLKRLRKVNWIVKGIQENIVAMNGGTSMTLSSVYRLNNMALSDVYRLVEKHLPALAAKPSARKNHVFIIDEINRGNISKVFGEMITLIEESKRLGKPEGMSARLPYSQKLFGVPENVFIIGTMNTADRSIAAIDTALRRRFTFREMLPKPEVLADIQVEDLSIGDMLRRLNQRITVLYDREHTIGHAYFMKLREEPTIDALAEIFRDNIIPLLQEYFYEDYQKIRLVLGDHQKESAGEQFIIAHANNYADLFGDVDVGLDEGCTYEINDEAFGKIEAYRSI